MAAVIIKTAATPEPKYGVADLSATLGFNQSESENRSGTWASVTDHNGQIIARILYDTLNTNTLNVVLIKDKAIPKIGDPLTVAGVVYTVENVVVAAQNNDVTRLTLTVSKYQGITRTTTP